MSKFNFEILGKDVKSDARAGVIHTVHGDIKTPSFVPVGTQATVKSMSNEDLQEIGVQVFFVNTYHLYLRPGLEAIEKGNGLHSFIGWGKPLMTDSAGFQIFSLGDVNRQRKLCLQGDPLEIPLVKISEEGVKFRSHLDGSEHLFTPEKSIEVQRILGADIMIAFDECCYYPATHDYAKKAMERTHRWALRCLERSSKFHLEEIPQGGQVQSSKLGKSPQALYGVVQGGVFEDLRKESAKFISNLPFEGVAIGGVAVGESKKEMEKVLDWVVPLLPKEKPRHLLGVGEIDDIFTLVEKGIDSFDCVMPTRLGRMGHLLVRKVENREWKLDITK
ncbi:tRNA guanosine(34) transglycosylase Tgt, partial [Candidatus Shapirobacteria bacterium CG07_land_8_20_14_0_80_39_18]